jgi:hypothetical protein
LLEQPARTATTTVAAAAMPTNILRFATGLLCLVTVQHWRVVDYVRD